MVWLGEWRQVLLGVGFRVGNDNLWGDNQEPVTLCGNNIDKRDRKETFNEQQQHTNTVLVTAFRFLIGMSQQYCWRGVISIVYQRPGGVKWLGQDHTAWVICLVPNPLCVLFYLSVLGQASCSDRVEVETEDLWKGEETHENCCLRYEMVLSRVIRVPCMPNYHIAQWWLWLNVWQLKLAAHFTWLEEKAQPPQASSSPFLVCAV